MENLQIIVNGTQVGLGDLIALHNQSILRKQAYNERMKEYMKEYRKAKPLTEEQRARKIASTLGIPYEVYMERKEAGLMKRGRPRKTPTVPAQ